MYGKNGMQGSLLDCLELWIWSLIKSNVSFVISRIVVWLNSRVYIYDTLLLCSLSLCEYMTQIGKRKRKKKTKTIIEFKQEEHWFRLKIANLTFVWTRTYQKTNKCESDENDSNNSQISKYDDSIMAGTKSTETKQILKDNTKQTRYSKTKPDSGT